MELMQRRRELMTFEHGHWVTATGSIVTFNTPFAKPLRSLKAEFMPVQEGTGDPSPDNVRPITGWTGFDVTRCGRNLVNADNLVLKEVVTGSYQTLIFDKAGTYYVKAFVVPSSDQFIYARIMQVDGTFSTTQYIIGAKLITPKTITITDGQKLYLYDALAGHAEETTMRVFNEVQLSVYYGEDSNAYEPYSGTTIPVTFPAVGKNLLDVSDLQTGVWWNGSILTSYTANKATRKLPIKPNTTYFLKRTSGSQNYCSFFDKDGGFLRQKAFSSNWQSFTTESDEYFIGITLSATDYSTAQLELGSSSTVYEPYTNTVYGGYVDLVTGEIWGEWELKKNSSQVLMIDAPNYLGDVSTQFYFQIPARSTNDTRGYVDCAKYLNNSAEMNRDGAHDIWNYDGASLMHMRWLNSLTGIEVTDDRQTRITKIKAYIANNPIHTCIPLATPIMLGVIDPTTITTLIGVNNIWSTANGNVTAEYWTR